MVVRPTRLMLTENSPFPATTRDESAAQARIDTIDFIVIEFERSVMVLEAPDAVVK
jgi:hypothetical protein